VNAEQIAQFYAARDARTIHYGGLEQALQTEMYLIAGDASTTRPGQVALLALVNMVARTHRHLTIDLTPAPLRAATMMPAPSIEEAVAQMATAINPAALLTINGVRIDANEIDDRGDHGRIRLGVGVGPLDRCDVWLGWWGGRGQLGNRPAVAGDAETDVLGAATAACLGAAALFHLSHGRNVQPVVVNLAERISGPVDDGDTADPAAPIGGVGTRTVTGPIDAGNITIVGAGAVAHGLAWWAREFGHHGEWSDIDGDVAELSNTNRCLVMSAADAGWPAGLPGAPPRAKADILADMVHARSVPLWFDESSATEPPRTDLILVLANERGVRARASALGEPILLHATTSPSWAAELHRHMPDVDDCPACRIPDTASPTFACSTGPAGPEADSGDAALPFLSAAAGLMLTVALQHLSPGDGFLTSRHNHWRLCFESAIQLRGSVHPRACPHTLPAAARRLIHSGQPRRHDHLDIANHQ
jgi:hypothetical protein